ncbi:hypothetical protein INR49_014681 [Caranx melampygus]|nr:hypothetical protein INR49_014681 [Caranx melampygus]
MKSGGKKCPPPAERKKEKPDESLRTAAAAATAAAASPGPAASADCQVHANFSPIQQFAPPPHLPPSALCHPLKNKTEITDGF